MHRTRFLRYLQIRWIQTGFEIPQQISLFSTNEDMDPLRRISKLEKLGTTLGPSSAMEYFNLSILKTNTKGIPEQDLHRTAGACDQLLLMCGKTGDFELALSIVDIMNTSSIPVGNVAHGAVLNAFCKAKELRKAVDYLSEIHKTKSTVIMYNTVLSACASRGQVELFKRCLEDMEMKGIVQDDGIWVQRIRIKYKSTLEDLKEEWKVFWDRSGHNGSYRVFSAYLVGLANFGDGSGALSGARELISEFPLEAKDTSPHGICQHHSFVWNSLLGYCLRHRDWEMFRSVNALMNISGFPKNHHIFRYILAIQYYSNQTYDQLLNTVKSMEERGIYPDHASNVWLLRSCLRQMRPDLLKVHWHAMLNAGVIPNTRCYNIMIEGAALEGDLKEAQSIFQSLIHSSSVPDQCTFLALFHAATAFSHIEKRKRQIKTLQNQNTKQSGSWSTAFGALKQWETDMSFRFNIKFSRATLIALLRAYRALGSVQDMLRVRDQARNQGLAPNLAVYNVIISAAAGMGEKETVLFLLQEMIDKKIEPCVQTYTSLLLLYLHKKHLSSSSAWEVISSMESKGIQPTSVTQEILLETCQDRRQLMKYMEWFLKPMNIVPRLNTWICILKKCNALNCEDLVTEVMSHHRIKTLTKQLEMKLSKK